MRSVFGTLCVALLALPALLVGGCGSDSGAETLPAGGRPARTRWNARGLTSYQYTLRVASFSPETGIGAVRVTVRNGQPTVTPVQGPELTAGAFARYDTVPELLDVAEEAERTAESAEIEYDPTYGFPSTMSIDYIKLAVDDELGVYVTDFQPL